MPLTIVSITTGKEVHSLQFAVQSAESVEFSINSTHIPDKCPRKSEEGAVMKVHYVGRLLSTNKIFASSFHTGSQPFRFVLGSDEVIAG